MAWAVGSQCCTLCQWPPEGAPSKRGGQMTRPGQPLARPPGVCTTLATLEDVTGPAGRPQCCPGAAAPLLRSVQPGPWMVPPKLASEGAGGPPVGSPSPAPRAPCLDPRSPSGPLLGISSVALRTFPSLSRHCHPLSPELVNVVCSPHRQTQAGCTWNSRVPVGPCGSLSSSRQLWPQTPRVPSPPVLRGAKGSGSPRRESVTLHVAWTPGWAPRPCPCTGPVPWTGLGAEVPAAPPGTQLLPTPAAPTGPEPRFPREAPPPFPICSLQKPSQTQIRQERRTSCNPETRSAAPRQFPCKQNLLQSTIRERAVLKPAFVAWRHENIRPCDGAAAFGGMTPLPSLKPPRPVGCPGHDAR